MGRSKRKRRGPQAPGRRPVADSLAASDLDSADDLTASDLAPPGESRWTLRAIAGSVQAEDMILFFWIVLLGRLIQTRFGEQLRAVATFGQGPRWIYVVVLGGLAIVFYTRGPADADLNEASSRRCVLGLSGWFVARSYFAGDPNWMGKAFTVAFVVVLLMSPLNSLEKLPRTGFGLRRALVLPAELVGNSVFSGMITPDFLRGAELQGVAPEYRVFGSFALSAFLFIYVVIGPRVMAGEDWRPFSWMVRLGVYLAALQLGHPSWLAYAW
jgi:hypothetical protein